MPVRPTRRAVLAGLAGCAAAEPPAPPPPPATPAPAPGPTRHGRPPRNVVVVMVDDQRWDMLGFLGHPFLETPSIDRLAREGRAFRQAFVTTSLCCPSRATFLTGLYAHAHGVLDNRTELPDDLPTWNRLVHAAGVETGFFGKYHLGSPNPHPRPGWTRWVAFGGQGTYVPGEEETWSFDGELRPVSGYTTDLVTDHAVAWLEDPARRRAPFAAVVSHKAVHAPFVPAERHRERYADAPVPSTLPDTDAAYAHLPDWLRHMRHDTEFGVEKPYRQWPDFASWYRDYHRTLLAVDESVGRLLEVLERADLLRDTAVLYTSDNGFMVGEKGVLDKRNAYEPSIRVPMILRAPGLAPGPLDALALNVDLAPTILDLLGFEAPDGLHGRSLLSLDRDPAGWRKEFVYEYFHEPAFPSTPTLFGLRTERLKLVAPWGTDDPDELYDLQRDPGEATNRIDDPEYADRKKAMAGRMRKKFADLGMLPTPVWGRRFVPARSGAAEEDDGPAEAG